ncbi:hypothetical protein [Halococcoides cellulosivorans]|uniref:hypothetical protein n=1 Tax=Halococcoides cellulosivorans TaxID=1679096 RepID=UPI001F48F4C5
MKIEPLRGHGVVIRMEIIELLSGETLQSSLMWLDIDVVQTDRLDALAVDVCSKILDVTNCPPLDDLRGRAVENNLLSGREGGVRHRRILHLRSTDS